MAEEAVLDGGTATAGENTADTTETVVEAGDKKEKSFSQKEVDEIVKDRLQRAAKKYDGFEDYKNKAALVEEAVKVSESLKSEKDVLLKEKENFRLESLKLKKIIEKGLPMDAIDLISGTTDEEIEDKAEKLLKLSSVTSVPSVPSESTFKPKDYSGTDVDDFYTSVLKNIL